MKAHLAWMAGATLVGIAAACAGAGRGGSAEQWEARRSAILKDRAVARCYTFSKTAERGVSLADEAGSGQALSYGLTPLEGAPPETLETGQGRWPGKAAVRLDRGVLSAAPCVKHGEPFTVELWFRKNGPGLLRGNDNAPNGTLVSEGNGYWSGWRVTTSYPEGTFGFEIGRPQPAGSAGFFGRGPLPDGVWHHLAATWDGSVMRLFLNGLLAGAMPYAGAYTPGEGFRIGYADAGWGSVKLDVDAIAIYRRALSSDEVLRSALYSSRITPDQSGSMSRAGELLHDGKPADAAGLYGAVAAAPGADGELRALANLALAECRRRVGDGAGASRALASVAEGGASAGIRLTALSHLLQQTSAAHHLLPGAVLEELMAMPGLSDRQRTELRLSMARRLIETGAVARGQAAFASIMKDTAMDDAARHAAQMELAHTLMGARRYADARAAYQALASDGRAAASLRARARMLALRTLVREGKVTDAVNGYREALVGRDIPLSVRHEAEEALKELGTAGRGRRSSMPTYAPAAPVTRLSPGRELHVAPNGADENPGTAAKPLRSWRGAIAAITRIKARGALPRGGIAVTFHRGEYDVTDTIRVTASCSGTAQAPIVFRAAKGSPVIFRGGVRLTVLKPVSDPDLRARLPEAVRDRVRVIDLKAARVTDVGSLRPRGVGPEPRPVPELFWNGRPLRLARWPNEGWVKTGRILEEKNSAGGFTFEYGDAPGMPALESEGDAWLFGYFGWLWADSGVKVASADPAIRRIVTASASGYAPREGMPWYAYNVLGALDQPGEWYLDSSGGRIVVYPPSDPDKAVIEYSTLDQPFVSAEGASHVRFEGLTFELGRWNGIELKDCESVHVVGCRIRKLRGTAVTINGGRGCGVFGSELAQLGRNGVSVSGGDRKTLAPSGHFVDNCHIHDFSRWDRTYTPAAYVEGVGVRISHNLIHGSPGHAMRIEGNDHVIEFNEVHHVVTETDDQGALDMWFNPTYRGVVIRHNFWHHIGGPGDEFMRAGIRLDDAICGVLIYGNVFWKAAEGLFGGVQIHGGKENEVVNNLFVNCKYGVSFSRWGPQRWEQTMQGDSVRKATREDVDITRPPYSDRYPALARLDERPDVNQVWGNVAVNCGAFLTRDGGVQDALDNYVTAVDPGFADMRSGDFSLRPDADLLKRTGFRPIPFRRIGRYPHPLAVAEPKRGAR